MNTASRMYANSAQRTDEISRALSVARGAMGMASNARRNHNPSLAQTFKMRAYAYLNRACELACQPVHLRVVVTASGLEDAWHSYAYIATPDGRSQIESVFLGYAEEMNEDQARARAMGY